MQNARDIIILIERIIMAFFMVLKYMAIDFAHCLHTGADHCLANIKRMFAQQYTNLVRKLDFDQRLPHSIRATKHDFA